MLVANVYKGSKKMDKQVDNIIFIGFTCQLKRWRDLYLTTIEREMILN